MKKNKINLDDLKIVSFVTDTQKVNGGSLPPGMSCVYTDGDACAHCYAFCESSYAPAY